MNSSLSLSSLLAHPTSPGQGFSETGVILVVEMVVEVVVVVLAAAEAAAAAAAAAAVIADSYTM